MARLFDDRAGAAESAFIHGEETRQLVQRRGIQALAAWASECMGLDEESTKAYESKIVDRFINREPDEQLIETVQTDLERAGKPALTTQVGPVFSHALADADAALRGGGRRIETNADAFYASRGALRF